MSFSDGLSIVQIIIDVILLLQVLTQSKGSAFSGSFSSDAGATYRSRRGLEAFVFRLTIAMGVAFVVVSLIAAVVRQLNK